jgi:hypothetical protein
MTRKQFRDCDLKGRILRQVQLSGSQSKPTARELFEAVNHPNFDSFLSSLHRLKKYGYISTVAGSHPYRYTLTRKGETHAQDPYKYKRAKQEGLQMRISAILNDDEQFSQAVEEEVRKRLSEIESGTREPPIIETEKEDNTDLKEELEEKNSRIQELEAQVQHLIRHKLNVPTKPVPIEKSPEEQKAENERRQRREGLVVQYQRRYLDAAFFSQWGDILPYKMSHMQLYREGSVEILSKSNKEHARGHTRRLLYPQEILNGKYRIIKVTKNGISIAGQGLPGGQTSLRW